MPAVTGTMRLTVAMATTSWKAARAMMSWRTAMAKTWSMAARAMTASPPLSMPVTTCTRRDAGSDVLDYSATTLGVIIYVGEGIAEGEEIGRDEISGFEVVIGGRGNDSINSGRGSISMTGGEGEDTFEFETPDQDNRGSLVRTITDFTVGDRLLVAFYEFRDNSGQGNAERQFILQSVSCGRR